MKIAKKKNIIEKKISPSKGGIDAQNSMSGKAGPKDGKAKGMIRQLFPKERNYQTYIYKILKSN